MFLDQNNLPAEKFSRIISLVPSQTELLHYLGLDHEVVGITKFCIHPKEWFKVKSRVGGTKMINFDIINQLAPNLIIANREENEKAQIEELARHYNVWVTDVNSLRDAVNMIHDIGKLTGREQKASTLNMAISEKFSQLKKDISPVTKIKTAYFIWQNPYMVAGGGTFINDMLNYCGFENTFSHLKRYPQISFDDIKKSKTELILLSSEPYPFQEKHKAAIQNELPHIKIKLVDGEMFSWYGSRLLKSADYFRTIASLVS
jgi:ABC-type Fe3+-hydroxamate transport system substrate-binding protein